MLRNTTKSITYQVPLIQLYINIVWRHIVLVRTCNITQSPAVRPRKSASHNPEWHRPHPVHHKPNYREYKTRTSSQLASTVHLLSIPQSHGSTEKKSARPDHRNYRRFCR